MKKGLYLLLAVLCFAACEKKNAPSESEFVDLGLTSGTKWKSLNESNPKDPNGFYNYEETMAQFGKNVPTKEQWQELLDQCTWTWTGKGYRATGPNKKTIDLPAEGYCDCEGAVLNVDTEGNYWASTLDGEDASWGFSFTDDDIFVGHDCAFCNRLSVRLVHMGFPLQD